MSGNHPLVAAAAPLDGDSPPAGGSAELSPHLLLLEALGQATPKAAADPPRRRRVFVNRTLRMDQIDVIGFDMDYTLALYHQPRLEQLSARCTLRKLVEKRGYPAEIADLPYDSRFGIRGLVVDQKQGNLLKMDRYGFVGRGYHGTRPLSRADRSRLYREQQLRLSAGRYSWIDTLFAIPEAVLYAQLVDFLDRDADFVSATADSRAARYTQLWTDIRESIDEAHRDDSIKREITANLGDYIVQDPELAATLHRFRSAGKRLFLLTNSGFAYTDRVMSYLLSDRLPNYPSWRSYFDAVIVDAQKPAFFVDSRPLLRLDSDGQVVGVVPESASSLAAPSPSELAAEAPSGLAAELRSSAAAVGAGQPWLLQGGNVRILSAVLGLPADRVLYIGDHIYGDMLRAKRSSVWRTAMVVQELEEELDRHAQVEAALQQLEALDRRRHRLDAELRYQQLLAQQLEQLSEAAVGELLPDPAQSPLPPSPQWALELSPVAMAAALRVAGAVDELGRRAMLDGAGTELRRRIAELDAGLLSTVAEISRLERDIEHTFNPFWGPLFKESTENSRLGEQVEDYACLYTSRVSNFLAYSPFQYFRSPRDHLPHERVY